MLSGKYRGTDIGSGTNTWSMSEDLRAGKITLDEFHEAEVVHAPLARPLHDDGHRVHHGVAWSRRWASGCRATPPIPQSTRAATCSRAWRAGASSRW